MTIRYLLLLLPFFFFTCKTATPVVEETTSKLITLKGVVKNCTSKEPIGLYEYNGMGFKRISDVVSTGKDSFQLQILPTTSPQFYYIGQESQQKMPIVLGTEKEVSLTSNCNSMRNSKITNSPLNKGYNDVLKQMGAYNGKARQLGQQFMQHRNNPQEQTKVIAEMKELDDQKLQYLDSLKITQPFIAKVLALNTYLSFQNNQGAYTSEIDYFADQYFRFVDLKDPDFANIPYLFEATKNYAVTLSQQPIPQEDFYGMLDKTLAKLDPNSRAYKYALSGMAIGLQSKNHPGFIVYGTRYFDKYGKESSPGMAKLHESINRAKSFTTGAEAPDFTQNTPEGNPLSLSELRGKVILIDFWASWCGPCRKENPHVVKIYNKYKDKGFDVLGVSLDKKKGSWLKAIEKDKLPWHHVSDLRGWQNAVAKTYSVTSIPHTVLVDKDGKIIARNLRSAGLENQLRRIFGE